MGKLVIQNPSDLALKPTLIGFTVSVDWGRVHLQSLSSLPVKTGLVTFCTGEWGDEIRRCSRTSSPCVRNQYLDDFHRFPFLRLTSRAGAMLLESHLMLFWPQNGWLFWLRQNCFPIHPAWLQQQISGPQIPYLIPWFQFDKYKSWNSWRYGAWESVMAAPWYNKSGWLKGMRNSVPPCLSAGQHKMFPSPNTVFSSGW